MRRRQGRLDRMRKRYQADDAVWSYVRSRLEVGRFDTGDLDCFLALRDCYGVHRERDAATSAMQTASVLVQRVFS